MAKMEDTRRMTTKRTTTLPKTYLFLNNPKPTNNLGPMLRCASAFAISEVVLVGYRKCNTEGAHGADKHLNVSSVTTWDHAMEYVRQKECQRNIQVVGILGHVSNKGTCDIVMEDDESGISIQTQSFSVNAYSKPFENDLSSISATVFIILDDLETFQNRYLASTVCTLLVHVAHCPLPVIPGITKPVSLIDSQSRFSIVLHHFNTFVGMKEQHSRGYKFEVTERHNALGKLAETDHIKAAERRKAKKQLESNVDDIFQTNCENQSWGCSLFGEV